MNLEGKGAIVTGASSGIGEATAIALAKEGVNVMLTARREDKLRDLADRINDIGKGKAIYSATDVTNREEVEKSANKAKEEFGGIDILINNAGVMHLSMIDKLWVDEWDNMIDVNIKGVMYNAAAALPSMIEKKGGHIVNISSVAGRRVMKGGSVYSATKYAVRAFSEGLRQEFSPSHGIRVTCIEPGAVATELGQHINDQDIIKAWQSRFGDLTTMESEDIADAIVYAIKQPQRVSAHEILLYPTEQM
ncbi:MAG: SDR family oxidoreductase [Candidatus Kapaibacteriales bacterium]